MSNPCRLKCFGQEIVIYREDIMARMLRNLVGVKPDVQNDDMKRFVCFPLPTCILIRRTDGSRKLVQSVIDQSHLSPFTKTIQPVLSEYDHTLRLYPMPNSVSGQNLTLFFVFDAETTIGHSCRQMRIIRIHLRGLSCIQSRQLRRTNLQLLHILSCTSEVRGINCRTGGRS